MLLTGSLNDPRTGYWEPAKFVAKMRASKLGSRLLLLKVRCSAPWPLPPDPQRRRRSHGQLPRPVWGVPTRLT